MNRGKRFSGLLRRLLPSVPTKQRRAIRKIIYSISPFSFDFALDEDIDALKSKINLYFRFMILKRRRFSKEIDFLNNKSRADNLSSFVFPYPFVFNHDSNLIKVFKDEGKGLFYVIHKGRRLYYSRDYQSEEEVRLNYCGISIEQDEGSPHRYITDEFNVEKNDTVIDIGAAEGNFSLDVVERAGTLYMFEPDIKWVEALKATFEPWKEKVLIIHKKVSDRDDDDCVRLDSFLRDKKVDYIKIDAEGDEPLILKGSRNILNSSKSLRLAVCTYHRKNDSGIINEILCDSNFKCTYSNGYMLFIHKKLTPPYFRRALIRAQKIQI